MKCHDCKKVFNAGSDWERRIEIYRQTDGTSVEVGFDREVREKPAGARLLWIEHYKCFLIRVKKESRADVSRKQHVASWDQVDDDVPGTRALAAKMAETRQMELEAGYGKTSWSELEKARAAEHGGPYDHEHPRFVAHYQLAAHLYHAHGIEPNIDMARQRVQHDESHAALSLARTRAAREADPGHVERGLGTSDWRDQEVWDVQDLPAPEELQ